MKANRFPVPPVKMGNDAMKNFNLTASAAVLTALVMAPMALAASDADVKGVQAAKMSLADAIQSAQKAGNGKAIYGKYDTRNGVGNYEVVVISGGKDETLRVDPNTGEAVKAKQDDADRTDKNGVATIEAAQVTLADAITTAEQQGGRALTAELDTKKNTTAYEIEVAKGGDTDTVWVDVNTGKIVKKS
jgi:uncharacterized membrane protein YkoI